MPERGIALRLGALAAAVVAAHALLLEVAPLRIGPGLARASHWVTRVVTPPAAPPADMPRATAAATPSPPPAPRQRRAPTVAEADAQPAPSPAAPPGARADSNAEPAAVEPEPVPTEWITPTASQARPASGRNHAAVAFRVLPSARYHYKVVASAKGFELQGLAELDWRHDGSNYEARLELASPLLPRRMQQSTGVVGADGLEPLRFADRVRSEQAAHFQRDQGTISFSNNKPDVPLESGAQDRLSVILQLAALLAGSPQKYGPGTSITMQVASVNDAEPWVFTVEGQERLQLPGGHLSAVKLVRNPRRDFDTKVELWLAPGMDYAPIRLRLTQPNGDWVDQQWSSTDRN